MKNFFRLLIFSISLLLITGSSAVCFADDPPPGPPGGGGDGGHGLGGNQGEPLLGAPVGDGIWILIILAAGYGVFAFRSKRKKEFESAGFYHLPGK